MKQFCVYILTNKPFGTLYIGVTSWLAGRTWQHKNPSVKSFASRYNLDKLVYYELHESAESAITREKQLKKWLRAWKLNLISQFNPSWDDLYEQVIA